MSEFEVLRELEPGTVFDGLLVDLFGLLHHRVRADDGHCVVQGFVFAVDVRDQDQGRTAVVRIAGDSRGVALSEALVADVSWDMGGCDAEPVSLTVVAHDDRLLTFELVE